MRNGGQCREEVAIPQPSLANVSVMYAIVDLFAFADVGLKAPAIVWLCYGTPRLLVLVILDALGIALPFVFEGEDTGLPADSVVA